VRSYITSRGKTLRTLILRMKRSLLVAMIVDLLGWGRNRKKRRREGSK
jgi:hypothetical protein